MIEVERFPTPLAKDRAYGYFTSACGERSRIAEADGDSGETWVAIEMPRGEVPYLSRENVRELLPLLQRFAETGRIDG